MYKSILLWCFVITLTLELVFLSVPRWHSFQIVTKPLLISTLLFYFLLHRTDKKTKLWILLALLFSIAGDIILLFTGRSENYFILGLAAFLLAHIFYIVEFSRNRNKKHNFIKPLLPLLLFGGLFFYFLKDGLGALQVPVFVYMALILTMVLFAFLRKGAVSGISFELVFTGALLFLISDGILAIDKFYNPMPLSGIFIMGTYGLAQFLIVLGVLNDTRSNSPQLP